MSLLEANPDCVAATSIAVNAHPTIDWNKTLAVIPAAMAQAMLWTGIGSGHQRPYNQWSQQRERQLLASDLGLQALL